MNLSRIFAQAFVRRLAYVLAAIVLAAVGIGRAEAADYSDQGQAYAGCLAATRAYLELRNSSLDTGAVRCVIEGTRTYRGEFETKACSSCSTFWGQHGLHTWPAGKNCSDRTGDGDGPPSNQNAILVGSGGVCYNGCAYGAPLGEATTEWSFSGGQTLTYVPGGSRVPTGAVCDAAGGDVPPSEEEVCQTVGNLTQCLMPDGRHCAVSSKGTKFCFRPNETGTKTSKNEAVTKAPQGVGINPPPTPPANNGEWQQAGSGTASVSSGGTTNNYNVQNYESNYGTDGEGGGAEGDPGEGDGEGDDGFGEVGGDGTCTGTFTCTGGDPVLCATARQTYLARCEADARTGGEASPFPGDGDGGAGEDPAQEEVRRDVTMGLGMLDDTGFLGGGSCPSFGSFSVMGQSIDFDPDGRWCDVIGVARNCLLLLGAFIALGILVGRNDT